MLGGQPVSSVFRQTRPGKDEKIAKLEWSPSGGLGRALIGKVRARCARFARLSCLMTMLPRRLPYR
jgi:hypothetical protein